jgi:transcriptional regulator with XRE-family HTH domain
MPQPMSGKEIRIARLERQMTQEFLAGIAGVHRSELSLYENGEIELSAKKLENLERALARTKKHSEKDEKRVRKYYRQRVGITQQSLAQQVGIDPAILSKWENGKIEVSKETYEQIYRILDAAYDRTSKSDAVWQLEVKSDWAKTLERRIENLKRQLCSAQETMTAVFESCQAEISGLESELKRRTDQATLEEKQDRGA